jgi:hypothetical protein
LGKSFFNNFINKTDSVISYVNFKKYFKGIALVPENTGSLLISSFLVANSGITLQLHYHYNVLGKPDHIIYFLANPGLQFNHIDHDKSGTLIENLSHKNGALNSSNTGNVAYVQGITGISAKLEFPNLNNLLLRGKTVYISSAQLTFKPIPGSYGSLNPLPDSLILSVFNPFLSNMVNLALNRDIYNYGLNTQYSIDITSFIQGQLGALPDKGFLKLSLPIDSKKNSLRRLVLGNGQNLQSQAKIELKLMIYDAN